MRSPLTRLAARERDARAESEPPQDEMQRGLADDGLAAADISERIARAQHQRAAARISIDADFKGLLASIENAVARKSGLPALRIERVLDS